MGRIVRSRRAKTDALQIWVHVAEDNFDAADRLIASFDAKLRLLSDFPGMGQARTELAPNLRSLPVGNYLIFYRPLSAQRGIEVVRIVHGARDLRRLFKP